MLLYLPTTESGVVGGSGVVNGLNSPALTVVVRTVVVAGLVRKLLLLLEVDAVGRLNVGRIKVLKKNCNKIYFLFEIN